MKSYLIQATFPVYQAMDYPVHFTHRVKQFAESKLTLVEQNKQLQNKILDLQKEVLSNYQLSIENKELRNLLKNDISLVREMMVSRVISLQTTPFAHYAILNRGAHDQVFEGQPVFDADGVLGIVEDVGAQHSKVILVSDPRMAIPVESTRTGERALAFGTGQLDQLEIRHVPATVDLKVGDSLVTSGLGGKFLPGYPVGMITHVSTDKSKKFKSLLVKSQTKLASSRYVFMMGKEKKVNNLVSESNEEQLSNELSKS